MKKKSYHKIKDAYDAFWFLHGHPKFNVRERTEITPQEAKKMEKQGYLITRDSGGKCYREWRHLFRHALDHNLDIFYTKTDKPGGNGKVDDDKTKNKYVGCWLEFGPLEYGYMSYDPKTKQPYDWDTETSLQHYHDTHLDTGGSTFDEALINLAKNVLKRYGDYNEAKADEGSKHNCGKPVCGDCVSTGKLAAKLGLKKD